MTLTVIDPGSLATVQDRGRFGWAHLGVPRGGALDAPAAELANRLVGNPPEAAVIETTMSGLSVRSEQGRWMAVTGARCEVRVGGRTVGDQQPVWVPAGAEVVLGPALLGVRSYLAVAGGIEIAPVLGSRSTDTLAWVGPPRLTAGIRLPVGTPSGPPRPLQVPPRRRPSALRLWPGPRADWCGSDALEQLVQHRYVVAPASNRVGLRLSGPALATSSDRELPSEGVVLGSVQVPPDGQPVIFLADHPVTGGYPVVAVVDRADLAQCAQLAPGDEVRFTSARG